MKPSGTQHTNNCRAINDSDWRKINAEDNHRTLYNKRLLELTSRNMTYDTFVKLLCALAAKQLHPQSTNAKDGTNLIKTPFPQLARPTNRNRN